MPVAIIVSPEEIERQRAFTHKIKEILNNVSNSKGRVPFALTETYGCQQNENDTERIRFMLKECGYEFT